MKKKYITGIIVLMAISLIGIISVQLIWIQNAVNVKNELFNRSVNEALQQTVTRLENLHDVTLLNRFFMGGPDWSNQNFNFEFHIQQGAAGNADMTIRQNRQNLMRQRQVADSLRRESYRQRIKTDSIRSYLNTENDILQKWETEMQKADSLQQAFMSQFPANNFSGNRQVLIMSGNDTILYDFDSLYEQGMEKMDSVINRLNVTATMPEDVSKRLNVKIERLREKANQMATEIYTWGMNYIDPKLVENTLKEELANKDIPIDFHFGIFRNKDAIATSEQADTLMLQNSKYKVKLYPNDILQKNLHLAVYFSGRDSFIYRSLGWLLASSLIFSLIILLTFALSLYYIFRQKKISAMKTDFINNMTHEFKTPIATIGVATDSIVNDKVLHDPKKIRYFAGMIKKENARMNRQVEDILTIARLDRNDFEFKWESLNLHEIIAETIQSINLQVEKRGGKIIARLNAANPMVTTDRMHCTNVIYNLLDNAVKYSDGPPQITIETKNASVGVEVTVTDNGIGMSRHVQAKVFERFYRKTSGDIHNVKGFGLGLSYVKAVVEANGGSIKLKSEPGRGSTFTLFFPFIKE